MSDSQIFRWDIHSVRILWAMSDVSVSPEVKPKARQIVVRRQGFDLVKSTAAF